MHKLSSKYDTSTQISCFVFGSRRERLDPRIIMRWKSTQRFTPNARICQECRTILRQLSADGNLEAERSLGHRLVCLGCGTSLLGGRYPIRQHSIAEGSSILLLVMSWDAENEIIAQSPVICHTCWQRATRQLERDVRRLEDFEAGALQVPIPPPMPRPAAVGARVPIRMGNIVLPNYKRTINSSRHCLFQGCHNASHHLIPAYIKCMMLKKCQLYIPVSARVCEFHLYSNDWETLLNNNLLNTFNSFQIENIIDLSSRSNEMFNFENVNEMTNPLCHYWTGLNVTEFLTLYNSIPQLNQKPNGKTRLGIYLSKLRTGDSNKRLSSLHNIPRSTIEKCMNEVRDILKNYFVPRHIGFAHMSRVEVAERNLLIPNNLFGNPNVSTHEMPLIVICDGTYIYVQKSSNYMYQKKTYSLHKYLNLVKPFLIVCCDGHILDVSGPYAATHSDAQIMLKLMENNEITSFFRNGDIFILDRGFRDAIPALETRGYKVVKPETMNEGEHQLSTYQANKSRCVTLCRWVVEIVNGRFKRDYKLLRQDYFNRATLHLIDDFKIAAALLNCFHPLIQDRSDALAIVARALRFLNEPNYLALLINEHNINRRRTMFTRINANIPQLQQFPRLEHDDLILISLGPYQIKQARSYYAEHLRENSHFMIEVSPEIEHSGEFLQIGGNQPLLLRGRIKSRHVSHKIYFTYILFDVEPTNNNSIDAIIGYCCKCVVGNRTVGCCCHVMCIIWYLSWARYQENISEPASFLDSVLIDIDL